METRINKFPYFLWLNKNIDIEIKENIAIYNDNETELEKVSTYEILALKHLPVFLIFFLTFTLPEPKNILFGCLLFGVLAFTIFKYIQHLFKVIVVLMLGSYYLIYKNYEADIEQVIYTAFEIGFITILTYDIKNLYYRDHYYYMKNIFIPFEVAGTRKYPRFLKFLANIKNEKKDRLQDKKVSWFNFAMSGYYVKLHEELK